MNTVLSKLAQFWTTVWVLAATAVIGQEPGAAASTDYARPELIALRWSILNATRAQAYGFQIWRPDGSVLTSTEVKELHNAADVSDGFYMDGDDHLPILVMLFRVDARAKDHQILTPSIVVEQGAFKGFATPSRPPPYAMAAGTLRRSMVDEWPTEVTIEVRYPVAEPRTVRTLSHEEALEWTASSPLAVDEGVQWCFERPRAKSKHVQLYPIGKMSADRSISDPMKDWALFIVMEDALRADLRRTREGDREVFYLPISPDRRIKEVRFVATEYRITRYERVRIHPELIATPKVLSR